MKAGTRVSTLQLVGNGVIVLLTLALLSTQAHSGDIIDLGGELPVLEFDLPERVLCREVTSADYLPATPGDRLIEVRVPVSVVVLKGDVQRLSEVIVEIDGEAAGLTVHDFSPDTQLVAREGVQTMEVKRTEKLSRATDASLGGMLPASGGTATLTPTIAAGKSKSSASTITETRLPPKHAVLVSGAVNRRQGVYFKLRQSSQTTLEGEHELTVVFVAPADWEGGVLRVECVGRGQKKWLFVKQRKVWNVSTVPVELQLASYRVAKPVKEGLSEAAVGEAIADSPTAQQ